MCRLILIAEKDTVYDKFPTPLINRLEKHFVLTSSILKDWQETVLMDFEDWITKFSDAGYNYCTYYCGIEVAMYFHSDSKFRRSDAFIGFQKDTPASVVFQASNLLRSATAAVREGVNVTEGKLKGVFHWHGFSWDIKEVLNLTDWNEAVSFVFRAFQVYLCLIPDTSLLKRHGRAVDRSYFAVFIGSEFEQVPAAPDSFS